ncbi:MAG: TlyA family RNA methyltransferase [Nitrospirae bacterium]|nr:MAG: TlyA family RNA methyltransferase [Nitrospirota bacterium]
MIRTALSPRSSRSKSRLDVLLVSRGLVDSREQAHRLILAGWVQIEGHTVDKCGKLVDRHAQIRVLTQPRFVSRAGEKLAAALDVFPVTCRGATAMDVGASTGGFTDCLLQYGAVRVYAIDVGYGQLDWKLREDPRVIVLERCNIRHLSPQAIPDPIDVAVVDVSFISLRLVLPCITNFLASHAIVVALVKPQFEVGKEQVGRGGIVRNDRLRHDAVEQVKSFGESIGLRCLGVIESPVRGRKGNREFLIGFRWGQTVENRGECRRQTFPSCGPNSHEQENGL